MICIEGLLLAYILAIKILNRIPENKKRGTHHA